VGLVEATAESGAERGRAPKRGPGWLRSWRWRALAFALIALVAVAGAVLTSGRAAQPSAAPGFSVARLGQAGSTVGLGDFRGRPVVMNFFAAWCPPCREELPTLSAAQRRVGGSVAFLGIDVSDSTPAALDLVRSSGVSYPLGVDPDYKVADSLYHLRGLPSTVFIDAKGNISATVLGQLSPQVLDQRLRALTGPPA
jgi:cytochrome c biogenesis protein CcmG/thiol:disulfide interchange protein DsbE